MFITDYIKVKDKYLLCYFGSDEKCINQLIYLRPLIEKEFPGITIFLSFSDRILESNFIKRSKIDKYECKKYAYVRSLKGEDPIRQLLEESHLCHLNKELPTELRI